MNSEARGPKQRDEDVVAVTEAAPNIVTYDPKRQGHMGEDEMARAK